MPKHATNRYKTIQKTKKAFLAVGIAAVLAGGTALTAYASMPLVKGADFKRQDILPSAVDKYYIPEPEPVAEEPQEEAAEEYYEPYCEQPACDYYSDPGIWGNDPADLPPEIQDGAGLTKSGGVNYHDGRRETYYSSNVLYHYRTGEWTADAEGFYRDANGYYVVAASDMPQGTTFEGSKGTCIVLDSGCAAGTTDYYVNWL